MRRVFAVLLSTALLAAGAAFVAPSAAADDALTPDIHVPLRSMWAYQRVWAATGSALVRTVYVNSSRHDDEYSVNNGATWRPVPADLGTTDLVGYGGEFIGLRSTEVSAGVDGCDSAKLNGFVIWNPNTGAIRRVDVAAAEAAGEVECLRMADAVRGLVLTSDGRVFDISGTTAVRRTITHGAGVPAGALPVGISADGTTVAVRASVYDPNAVRSERMYLATAPLNGTGGSAATEIKGLTDVVVSGQRIHYLVKTATRLAVCRAPIDTPAKAKCVTVRRGDKGRDAWLTVSQGLDVVTGWDSQLWLVSGTRVKAMKATASLGSLQGTGFRDPARPLISGIDGIRGSIYGQVSKNLGVKWSIGSRKVPTTVDQLALSANRVTAVDRGYADAFAGPLWYRDVRGSSVGPERVLAKSVTLSNGLFASSARTASDCCLSAKARFYDRNKLVRYQKLPFNVDEISGPYVDGRDRVWRADGKTFTIGEDRDTAVFGSLVAWLDRSNNVTIRDLSAPGASDIVVHLPKPAIEYNFGMLQLWGHWIGISSGSASQGDAVTSLVTNYRTGEIHTTSGELQDLGDGYALLYQYVPGSMTEDGMSYTVAAWDFRAGKSRSVPVPLRNQVAIDGIGRVAWVSDAAIEIAVVPGAGTSAPRLLGVVAKSSVKAGKKWTPQIDVSKPIKAGVLEIRDRNGRLARLIPTKASDTGSLRTLTWNGRNAAKKKVAAGTYTWTLKADATDGTGALTNVNGTAAASGSLKVTR